MNMQLPPHRNTRDGSEAGERFLLISLFLVLIFSFVFFSPLQQGSARQGKAPIGERMQLRDSFLVLDWRLGIADLASVEDMRVRSIEYQYINAGLRRSTPDIASWAPACACYRSTGAFAPVHT